MSEFDDIGQQLHAMRAEPDPEFARELDRRAAEWLRERTRRRLPSLRIAIPAVSAAAAAAAVVVALVVSGGDESNAGLEVAVVGDQGAAEALGAPLDAGRDAARKLEGGLAPPVATRVDEGEALSVRYFLTARAEGTVRLAGREAPIDVAAGSGRLEISTEGLPSGTHSLEIALPPLPPYRERVEIGG